MKPQLSLEAFADWCEKQPAELAYDWHSTWSCAIARYVKTLGDDDLYRKVSNLRTSSGVLCERLALTRPWTFGALAARLRAAA